MNTDRAEIERLMAAFKDSPESTINEGLLDECVYGLVAERDALLARTEAAERDAKRYRWLRDRGWPLSFQADTAEEADAGVDAAMAREAK